MAWKIYTKGNKEWDSQIKKLNTHYRQSFFWGKYKSLMSWSVLRLEYDNNEDVKTRVQVIYRKFGLFCAVYIPGGVCGDISLLNDEFKSIIKRSIKSKFIYIRVDNNNIISDKENDKFHINKWKKPLMKLHSSITGHIKIQKIENHLSDASRFWKRNFKKSKKIFNESGIEIITTNHPNSYDLVKVSSEMGSFKKIINLHSYDEFENLFISASNNVLFKVAYDKDKIPIAYRGMVFIEKQAWDFSAATSYEGRDSLMSYYLLIDLLNEAKNRNIQTYNIGGLEEKKSPGVFQFKKGLRPVTYQYSGEWEWANIVLLKLIINFIIFIMMSKYIRRLFSFINQYKF